MLVALTKRADSNGGNIKQRLQKRYKYQQRDISKSASELVETSRTAQASVRAPEVDQPISEVQAELRSRRSAAELCRIAQEEEKRGNEDNEEQGERPVIRRRRFTRKQRKSVTIEPETGLILAVGLQSTSSDDDDNDRQRRNSAIVATAARSASFQGATRSSGLSASTTALTRRDSSPRRKSVASSNRGPSARRTSRLLRGQQQNAASTSHLDMINEHTLREESRSLSVRDLNGDNVDFSNRDSVTKWTSQILAELESLPSSCVDLTQQQVNAENERRDRMARRFASPPSQRPQSLQIPPPSTRMTSSLFESTAFGEASDLRFAQSAMIDSTTSLPWALVMSASMSSSTTSTTRDESTPFDLEESGRERENSLNASTLIGSSTDSEGTPTAQSPSPPFETKVVASDDETPPALPRTPPPPVAFVRSRQQPLLPPTEQAPPIPAKRTRFPVTERAKDPSGAEEEPKSTALRMRHEEILNDTDRRLQSSIARMTQSVYGDLRDPKESPRLSIPVIKTTDWSSSAVELTSTAGDDCDALLVWKKRAECRAKKEKAKTSLVNLPATASPTKTSSTTPQSTSSEKHSVNRVVAALIRSIEDTRFSASDRPADLPLSIFQSQNELSPQDAGTQTVFSASRSSSFDWIHEPSEGALRDIKTPTSSCTPRSENGLRRLSLKLESSSETDDADREVALIADQSEQRRRHQNSQKLYQEMDEGIALLLEYGEPSAVQNHKDAISMLAAKKSNCDSLPSKLRTSMGRRSGGGHVDSVYDNIWERRNKEAKVNGNVGGFSPLVDRPSPSRFVGGSGDSTTSASLRSLLAVVDASKVKSGSCEFIVDKNENPQPDSSNSSFAVKLAERDADECCVWLKEAGFPQYVRQFEENKFPIDINSVRKDHLFLGTDSLQALFRRLDTLNRCAIMKVDNVVMRRRNDDYLYSGFDEDDTVALSGNWQYQRHSQTWSRVPNEPIYGAHARLVSTKPNWQPYMHRHGATPSGGSDRAVTRTDWYEARDSLPPIDHHGQSTSNGVEQLSGLPTTASLNSQNSKLQRSQSERIRERARAIMKKMDLRSNSRRRKESRPREGGNPLVIGDPVLLSYDSASPESMRMVQSARPNNLQGRGRSFFNDHQNVRDEPRSKSARRQGMVLLTPSSPESSSADDTYLSSATSVGYRQPQTRRRDCSMPPPSAMRSGGSTYRVQPQPSLAALRQQQTFDYGDTRRQRTPFDQYLYPGSPNSLTRTSAAIHHPVVLEATGSRRHGGTVTSRRPPLYDYYDARRDSSFEREREHERDRDREYRRPMTTMAAATMSLGSTTPVRPALSSGSSSTSTLNAHNLIIQSDGYYVHDISPELRHRRIADSPSTSHSSHLKVDTQKSESSVEHTDEETLTSTLHRRRDSGVGSSLSRSPSGPSTQRVRHSVLQYSSTTWQNAKKRFHHHNNNHNNNNNNTSSMSASLASSTSSSDGSFFTDVEMARCIDSLSIVELTRLRKLAYLRVTATLERAMGAGAMKLSGAIANGGDSAALGTINGGKNWSVQKLIKKIKHTDVKPVKDGDDVGVFGVSLETIYKRNGLCLPRSILEVVRFLRQMAPETVGIFRKNGVKSRIAELRAVCDRESETDVFVDGNRLDSGQVHDVADLLKQYLRELPEPLMTIRLSETLASIFMHVPEVERLTTVQYALLLLPDENREAIQTLLFFLHEVAKYSEVNNMTAQNLAVCFTPSLFHLSASRLDKVPTTRRHKTVGGAGMPTEREMKESQACQLCLTMMIDYARTIFMLPDAIEDRTDCEDDVPALKDLGLKGPRSFLVDRVLDMVKDHGERWKSWTVEGTCDGIEISSKKAVDSHPLKTFRVWVDVAAPPKEVMQRVMKERSVWDTSVVNWRTVEMVNAPDTDLHQYVVNDTIGHATRDCFLVRFHSAGLTEIRGACAIAERSVQCVEAQMLGGLPVTVLDQRFLIEPKAGHSRVTYIARVDLKGRSCMWYNKVYGAMMCRQLNRLRDSYQTVDDNGPETKV